jgi:hypothetical protein
MKNPSYSIPKYNEERQMLFSEDNNKLVVKPDYNVGKTKYPLYSMGYYQERDYSTCAPAPSQYHR